MTAFLKASTDCFSMTLFEVPVFDCTCNKTVLVCVCFSTNLSMNEFRSQGGIAWCPVAFSTQGGDCITDRPETTLNIIVSRATFLLFSSVGHFKSFSNFVAVPGAVLYSFLTKRAAPLHTLNVLHLFLNMRVPCTRCTTSNILQAVVLLKQDRLNIQFLETFLRKSFKYYQLCLLISQFKHKRFLF